MFRLFQLFILAASVAYHPMNANCGALAAPTHDIRSVADAVCGPREPHPQHQGPLCANLCVVASQAFVNEGKPGNGNARALQAFGAIIDYYVGNARRICGKGVHEDVRIAVHCDSILGNTVRGLTDTQREAAAGAPVVDFHAGSCECAAFASYDIVVSLTVAVGINPDWEEGFLLVPERYIPFNPYTMTAHRDRSYEVANDLSKTLPELLRQPSAVQAGLFHSDFHAATLLLAEVPFDMQALSRNVWINNAQ